MSISLELGTTSATQVLRQKDKSIVLKIDGYNYEFMSSCIFFQNLFRSWSVSGEADKADHL